MKAIIIGGGIAGLSAGVYAQQSGFDTTIYEMHSIPGGNCTSWKRKGYLFEGGMHWLVGSSEAAPLHRLWRETGALQENNPIYNRDPFLTYIDEESGPICLYRDPDRLQAHLLAISPQDQDSIRSLVKDIRTLSKLQMPVMDIKGVRVAHRAAPPLSMLLHLPKAMKAMKRLDQITADAYAMQFQHAGIRRLLQMVVGTGAFTASSVLFTLAGLSTDDSGYPKGGSLQMARNIADTFVSLGGTIHYNTRVQHVDIQEGAARGVWIEGQLHPADAVIVASDTLAAIDTLFRTPLQEPWLQELRQETTPLNCTFVCLGVEADLSNLPENLMYPLARPFTFYGVTQDTLSFNHYANFAGYAPEGCTPITMAWMQDLYDFWKAAQADGTYQQKKQELAQLLIEQLALAVPQTAGKVAVWDIATPLTYERYCGTYRGSWMSVMKPGYKRQEYPCKPGSINRLYFAGQRLTLPGGLPVAVTTGRTAVQHLCRDTDTVFQGKHP